MTEKGLTPAVQSFIAQYVNSVEQMEILCLLKEHANRTWSAPEVFKEVQSREKSVTSCMQEFVRKGLVLEERLGIYRFAPKSETLVEEIVQTAKAYHECRVRVVELIYNKPSGAIQDFADAFRLRKDK